MTDNTVTEKKIDKRSKEYRDSLKNSEVETKDQEIEVLKEQIALQAEQVKELSDMVQTVGKLTASNAKSLKNQPETKARGQGAAQRKVVHLRHNEFIVLKDFLEKYAGAVSYDKELCMTLGVHILKHRVGELLKVIQMNDFLSNQAIEDNITKDFRTVILK